MNMTHAMVAVASSAALGMQRPAPLVALQLLAPKAAQGPRGLLPGA